MAKICIKTLHMQEVVQYRRLYAGSYGVHTLTECTPISSGVSLRLLHTSTGHFTSVVAGPTVYLQHMHHMMYIRTGKEMHIYISIGRVKVTSHSNPYFRSCAPFCTQHKVSISSEAVLSLMQVQTEVAALKVCMLNTQW